MESSINRAKGSGQALDPNLQQSMGQSMGADFGGVKVHTDAQADELNRSIQAKAFTTGNDVFFRRGEYQPASRNGQELIAHELTHVVQQGGASVQRQPQNGHSGNARPEQIPEQVVQRHGNHGDHSHREEEEEQIQLKALRNGESLYLQCFIDSTEMKKKIGEPKKDKTVFGKVYKARSVKYKAVLDALDAYHQTANNLWKGNASADKFKDDLTEALTDLTTACTTYITAHTQKTGKLQVNWVKDTRLKDMTDFRDQEIPQEQYLVKRLAADKQFEDYDRDRPLEEAFQGAETASKMPAKIKSSGIQVDETPRDGHGMAVWVKIDAGDNPIEPDTSNLGRSIYGITFEYWETVDMPYDFKETDGSQVAGKKLSGEGKRHKQWNDVYAMQPKASTFDKTSTPIEMTWAKGVDAAKGGTLNGKKTLGIYDCPAVWGEANRYAKRSLKFRIIFKDAYGTKHEIFARQLVELEGTAKAAVRTYTDSKGNKIGSYTSAVNQSWSAMDDEDERIGEHGIDGESFKTDVPSGARDAISAFITKINDDEAKEFNFIEKDFIQEKAGGSELAYKDLSRGNPKDMKNYEIAGWYLLPYPQSRWKYYEYRVDGGLLVAIVNSGKLKEMYYTNNVTTPLVSKGGTTFNVRSFAQIPLEGIVPQATALPDEMVEAFKSKKALYEYVRNNHGQLKRTQSEYDLRTGEKFHNHLKDYLKEVFESKGKQAKVYKQIRDGLPDNKQLRRWCLNAAYKEKFGEPELTAVELAWRKQTGLGTAVASLDMSDDVAHATALLNLIKTHQGKGAEIEENYNIIHTPKKFGQVVYDALLKTLNKDGDAKGVLQKLFDDYGDVEYLIKPAYRAVFGEKKLQAVLTQLKTDEINKAVPDPNSEGNKQAKKDFLNHGLFKISNHEPSTKIGRFDAEYDPKTGALKIILKLAFDFKDYTGSLQKSVNATGEWDKTTWETQTKKDWIKKLKTVSETIWSQKFDINCIRPGWDEVPTVKTNLEIVEVAPGQEHFLVQANKATLVDQRGTDKLKPGRGQESSFVDTKNYKANIQQWDVLDKISDPTIHTWLHAAEKKQHVDTSYKLDRTRIEKVLKDTGNIEFEKDSSSKPKTPKQLSNLAEELERQTQFSSFSSLHKLTAEGGTAPDETGNLGDGRASHVIHYLSNKLKDVGDGYSFKKGATDKTVNGVELTNPDDPVTMKKYDDKWSRISAAHEIGHMMGLVDEYNPAASTDMVKKMISDGLLPPNTPTDHLTGAGTDFGGQEEKYSAFAKLLEDTNLNAPDFTLARQAKSTSIMTGGFEVMGMHYVTIWEVLTKLTAEHLDKKFWQLKG
ncbi:MAG: DUF4157 domain-containing protein [Cyanobacteria bacterium P01_D01_bin.56]